MEIEVELEPGKTLLVQGAPGTAAYLVLSGQVEISTEEAGPMGEAGPGVLLGEVAMIGGSPYSITARAVETVSTARIDRDLFDGHAGLVANQLRHRGDRHEPATDERER